MKFKIFTIFPEMFPGYLSYSIIGDALKANLWSLEIINIRDYAKDKRKTIDDYIYGGGSGMVMKPDVLGDAIEDKANVGKKIYLTPRGKLFNNKMSYEFSKEKEISIICGRYEGIDQRVIDEYDIEEVSIGDFIITGGEIAAQIIIDSTLRNIAGIIGNKEAINEESFNLTYKNKLLLEYNLYTKPRIWKNREVPKILLSGDHKKIKDYRINEAIEITKKNRPDLLTNNKK